jgi:hypothetical protein
MEAQYPAREVLNILSRLTPEHYVEVSWIDACEIRDATPKDVEKAYHTSIKAVGRFYGVRGDYLIIAVETSPILGARVLCIPLGAIMKIRVLTRKPVKVPLRVTKGGMAFKVIYVYVKS